MSVANSASSATLTVTRGTTPIDQVVRYTISYNALLTPQGGSQTAAVCNSVTATS